MRARRRVAAAAALTALLTAGVWAGIGGARSAGDGTATVSLTARLDAAQEVPKPRGAGNARGTFAAGLVRSRTGGTLSWRLTFSKLTGRAGAAHIHLGKRGKAGPVAVGLCGPCRSGARGTVKVGAKAVTALLGGGAYVNVHTARNAAGEIRGQVGRSAAPPPAPGTGTTTTGSGTTTYEDPYP